MSEQDMSEADTPGLVERLERGALKMGENGWYWEADLMLEAAAALRAAPQAGEPDADPRNCDRCGCATVVIECLRCHARRPHGEPPRPCAPSGGAEQGGSDG
jgi:hypothetical protein